MSAPLKVATVLLFAMVALQVAWARPSMFGSELKMGEDGGKRLRRQATTGTSESTTPCSDESESGSSEESSSSGSNTDEEGDETESPALALFMGNNAAETLNESDSFRGDKDALVAEDTEEDTKACHSKEEKDKEETAEKIAEKIKKKSEDLKQEKKKG